MTIENRTTVKTYFQTGDKPSQDQFENFIDSAIFYEDTSNFGRQLVSASSATSAKNLLGVGTVGNNLFTAITTASAQNELGGKTVGKILFETNTTASAQTQIGGGVVGRQIFEATTTASATNIIFQPATSTAQGVNYLSLPANSITVGNNSSTPNTDIDFFAGVMNFHDGSGQALSTAMTKRLQSTGSWSAGNNGNMLLSGARANSSTYHLFAIYKTDGTIDYGALLGVAGTTPDPTSVLPTGYTKYEYIASLLTDASGNIRRGSYSFRLDGSYDFEFNTPVESRTFSAAPTTATLQTVAVPLGLKFNCELACRGETGATVYSLIIDPQKTTTASSTNFNGYAYNNAGSVGYNFYTKTLTNTSAQVSLMSTLTNNLQILTKGYTYNPINR